MKRASGLFQAHATRGVPLSISITLCMKHGAIPNLAEFYFDALLQGWSHDTAESTIEAACRDNTYPFDAREFKERCVIVWQRHGGDLTACRDFLRAD